MNEPTLAHGLTAGEGGDALTEAFRRRIARLPQPKPAAYGPFQRDLLLTLEVRSKLIDLAYRVMQINALGAIDDVRIEDMPERQHRELVEQCEAFCRSLNPIHERMARTLASDRSRSAEEGIVAYLALLRTPTDQLIRPAIQPARTAEALAQIRRFMPKPPREFIEVEGRKVYVEQTGLDDGQPELLDNGACACGHTSMRWESGDMPALACMNCDKVYPVQTTAEAK